MVVPLDETVSPKPAKLYWPKSVSTALAAALRPELETIDGFIPIERFQSVAEPSKLLSRSIWRDEAAIESWRNRASHRATQTKGRSGVFRDYRLRIAGIVRDYGMTDRAQAPADSRAAHDGCGAGTVWVS